MTRPAFPLALAVLVGTFALAATSSAVAQTRSGKTAESHPITLTTPLGGWRNSSLDKGRKDYLQTVHYPASDVNTPENQSRMAKIAGQIRLNRKKQGETAGAPRRPYTLVVNGTAMPLKVHTNGRFSRPWNFSSGANDVEITSPDHKHRQRVHFYAAKSGQLQAHIRVVLSWSTDNTDLDLHVITPDGQHAWYGHRDLDNGGALDVDVTDGYGPEIFSSPTVIPGIYYVYVNYYGGRGSTPAGRPATLTVAHVTVITDVGGPDEKHQTFIVPMRHPGELTQVAQFLIPGQHTAHATETAD